jgi:hypothetical protein
VIHLKIADKNLLVSDRTADLLVDYAALLGRIRSADSVTLTAIGIDGSIVDATLLLNSGTVLVAETTNSPLPEPDNTGADTYMQKRLAEYADPSAADFESTDPFSEQG